MQNQGENIVGDTARELDRVLPEEIKDRGTWCGNELLLPYDEALRAIAVASELQIAILGIEAFEVRKDGLLTVDLADASRYVPFTGDWKAYVTTMNAEGVRWVKEHRLGENHGYILDGASEREFTRLKPSNR